MIPRDAYIGFRVDVQTGGVPTREHGKVLLAIGGKSWELRAGNYVLQATVTLKDEEDGPQGRWVGELDLPPVEVVVTSEMLAVN